MKAIPGMSLETGVAGIIVGESLAGSRILIYPLYPCRKKKLNL